jgi:hypothetical protein
MRLVAGVRSARCVPVRVSSPRVAARTIAPATRAIRRSARNVTQNQSGESRIQASRVKTEL